jgi:UDP-N-acetylmuramoyl-tripeptide--D-alanyl-D-alanine ligase
MGLDGIRFTLHHGDEALSVRVPLLGRHSVHTSLCAAALGLVQGLTWEEIVRGLAATAVQLKLVTVPGPKNSLIIDDTYNANPESMMAALNLLDDLQGRHVAVLGDMLELGHVEEASHRLIGRRVADVAQRLIAVGRRAEWIADEALNVGMPADAVTKVADAQTAVPVLESVIEEEDVVLVKGSLGMQMEKIINAIGRYD